MDFKIDSIKKDIKDYLHLYLGQTFMYGGLRPLPFTITGFRKTDSHADGYTVYVLDADGQEDAFPLDANGYLALRPLSDMTEEDVKFLSGFNTFQSGREVVKFVREEKCAALYYRWKSDRGCDDGYAYSSNAIYFDKQEWSPESTLYLLSKSFDLFGLIEAGLAIDKTKVPA